MKHVTKGSAPTSFEQWKELENENWTPTYLSLQNPEKQDVQSALLAEQGSVCCYCGHHIDLSDSHIEHFRPQDTYPELSLEWSNLHASCVRETKRGNPLHCGHGKDSAFDEILSISPLSDGVEERFLYTLYGIEEPTSTSDKNARYMIGLLKLNVDFLVNRREEALTGVFDNDFLLSATDSELEKLRDANRARDDSNALPDFGHVIARYAEQRMSEKPY